MIHAFCIYVFDCSGHVVRDNSLVSRHYRVPPLVVCGFGEEHLTAVVGRVTLLGRSGRVGDVALRGVASLDFRELPAFELHGLERAQGGWLGVTNLATALQQRTLLTAAAASALAHRNYAERLPWCCEACWQRVTGMCATCRWIADAYLHTVQHVALGLSRMDLGQRVVSRSRAERL